ncbi:MAG: hypothetical protein IJ862_05475 [Selenomonadaceae bacterium]|nr:hypothetical protein [Selenomonadaceae bacterium]
MEDNRKNLRKHIKAASDWLQQADKSIERKEDLKGDLKLMLAKAELQNAEKHQNRSRLTKVLSFATAALIAFGVLWVNDDKEEISQLSTPSISTTNIPDSPILEDNESAAPLSSAETPKEEVVTNQNIVQEQPEVSYEQPTIYDNIESDRLNNESLPNTESTQETYYSDVENLNIYYSEPIPVVSSSPDIISPEVKAPTEDMQKLMQSAGQILHAE